MAITVIEVYTVNITVVVYVVVNSGMIAITAKAAVKILKQ